MIKAEGGKVIIEGRRDKVLAEVTTILHILKELVSEEEYKAVIRLADKSKEQVSDEIEKTRERKQRK
jgi:hypothetical protein